MAGNRGKGSQSWYQVSTKDISIHQSKPGFHHFCCTFLFSMTGPESFIPEPLATPLRPGPPVPCLTHPGHLWNSAAHFFGMLLPCHPQGHGWELGGNITSYYKGKQQRNISKWHLGHKPNNLTEYMLPPQMIHNALKSKGNPSIIQTRMQWFCAPGTRDTKWILFTSIIPCLQ